jgi:dTMP kinase
MSRDKARGRFVVFEGVDGSGKTTQAGLAAEELERRGRSVLMCRDPGGTPIGERIRAILLDTDHGEMTVQTELLLYMASRSQLVHDVIVPAVAAGRIVIADRFVLSSVVYQTVSGALSESAVRSVTRVAVGDLAPDLQVLLDVPVHEAAGRKLQPADRMEGKGEAFLQRVRLSYLAHAKREPNTVLLPGNEAVEQVHRRVMEELDRVL